MAARLDEEGAVVGIERVQPAPMVEEPGPRGAAMARVSRGGVRLWELVSRMGSCHSLERTFAIGAACQTSSLANEARACTLRWIALGRGCDETRDTPGAC